MEPAQCLGLAFSTEADRLRVMADIHSEGAASPPVEPKAEISLTEAALLNQLNLARRYGMELVGDEACGRITHAQFLAEGRINAEALRELTRAVARLNATGRPS